MIILRSGTPIELIEGIWVKRDDLVSEPPFPRLGKLRGIARQIFQHAYADAIGAVDRSAGSRNTWAHAAVARELGIPCVGYVKEIGENQEQARRCGATLTRYDQSFSSVEDFYAAAQRDFYAAYPRGYIAEDDCFAPEIIASAYEEVLCTGAKEFSRFASVLVPTSSGGLAIGIMRALERMQQFPTIFIHRGGSRRSEEFLKAVFDRELETRTFSIVILRDERGSAPADTVTTTFPSNVTYERRAWRWLLQQSAEFRESCLFWNAGA